MHAVLSFAYFLMISIFLLADNAQAKQKIITDAVGRKVTVKTKTARIITTFKPATLCIMTLNLSDRLVGVDTTSRRDKLQMSVYPAISNLPDIGRKMTGLNFETILSLNPDLVIMYAQKDGVRIADRLVASGVPTIVILPETFESLNTTLRLIAKAVNDPEIADKPVKACENILAMTRNRIGHIPDDRKKSVYFASSLGFFNTSSGTMLMNDIINNAGGRMVSENLKGYFQNISPETLIQWNPDFIFINCRITSRSTEALSRPEFKSVHAVAKDRVFTFPSNLVPWDMPCPLTALSVLWMGQKLYPDKFSNVDFTKEADRFHKILFGKTFSEMGGIVE